MITGNRILTSNTIIWNPAGIGFSGGCPQIIFQNSTGIIKLNKDLVKELDKNFSRFDTGQYSKLNFGLIQFEETSAELTVLLGSPNAFTELGMAPTSTVTSKSRPENRDAAYSFKSLNATRYVDNLATKLSPSIKKYEYESWTDCKGQKAISYSQGPNEPRFPVVETTFEPTHALAMYTDETSSPIIQIDIGRS